MRRREALALGIAVPVAMIIGAAGWLLWPDGPSGRADPSDAEQVALGATVYAEQCASCHGADLAGEPDWRTPLPTGGLRAPPHDASGHTWHHSDELLFRYTKHGGAAIVGGDFQSNMPGFGDVLSDAEIWAVLAFIKSEWPADIRERQARLDDAAG